MKIGSAHTTHLARIADVYRQCVAFLSVSPTVIFLYLSLLLLDLFALLVLTFSHSEPVSYVLAPLIKAFWDESFLHYPKNFLLLPKLFSHAHFLILLFVGVGVSGVLIKKLEFFFRNEPLSIPAALAAVFKKSFQILMAWLLTYGLAALALRKAVGFFSDSLLLQFVISFVLGLSFQSLFSFILPAILIDGKGFFSGIICGVRFSLKHIVFIAGMLFLPVFAVVLIAFIKAIAGYFVVNTIPELMIGILLISLSANWLIDIFVTLGTTLYYLEKRTLK